MKRFKKSIFIFRRDLRLEDNTGLINALESSNCVYCLFILDKNLLTPTSGYSSFVLPTIAHTLYRRQQKRYHLLLFMKESLIDLQKQFYYLNENIKSTTSKKEIADIITVNPKLVFLFGDPLLTISKIIKSDKEIEAVFVNRDYTPYSINRDKTIKTISKSNSVEFIECADFLLNEPEEILNSYNKPFRVFFQYYNKAIEKPIRKENILDIKKYKDRLFSLNEKILFEISNNEIISNLDNFFNEIISSQISNIAFIGGRNGYVNVISDLAVRLRKYNEDKDILVKKATSHLSAYIKFGICSIREVYSIIQSELGNNHPLLRQLYWRDFFTYIGFHFPYVFVGPFQEKYRNNRNTIQWRNDPKQFELWCNGKTGFPIVDVGMRELNATGYLHNRLRLIVASFLVKDLHIDWRYGERYFALKLVDYDPSVNNGNWQWVASTGCDALPFFRIFNPWLQQKKIDPECIYIKKWIPELKSIPKKLIHEWYKVNENKEQIKSYFQNSKDYLFIDIDYPKPIVEHHSEMIVARQSYNI